MNELEANVNTISRSVSLPELNLIGQELHDSELVNDHYCSTAVNDREHNSYVCEHSSQKDQADAGIKRNHHYMTIRVNNYNKAFASNSVVTEVTAADKAVENNNTSQHNSTVGVLSQLNGKTKADYNHNLVNSRVLPSDKKSNTSSQSADKGKPK